MFESWISVQMYSHIKVSKLNQFESLTIRGASLTQQRLPDAYTRFSSPVSSLNKSLLLVAFSHFKSSPSSNTRADEYSCFQQLASTTHYSTIICKGCHQRRKDMCAHACITLKGWVKGAKMDRAASVASNEATAFYLFGSKTKDEMIWRRENLTEPKHHKTISPQRGICTEQRLQKVWAESKSYIVLLEVLNIFVKKKKKNLSKPAVLNEPANLHKVFSRFW